MGLRELKSELNRQDKETLIKHISELYKKYKPVKEYFDYYINPDENKLLKEYKAKVREGFYPKRGMQLKLSISRKAINNFKKLVTTPEKLADLLLYYVECGVEFTNDYGDIDESFYSSIENTFEKALKILKKELILNKYKKRTEKIVKKSSGIGWVFHDYLTDVFYEFFGE